METILYVVTYASIVIFVVAVASRYMRISKYPLNIRWELYPVPHEGKRAEHGGSRLEDTNWWEKEQHKDKGMELKFMIQEMVFIKALKEHNRKLWNFSFPFHFGLYLTAAFAACVIVLSILGLAIEELPEMITNLVGIFGTIAALLSILGGFGLLSLRLSDPDMKGYTNFSHIFNLLVIIGVLGLIVASLGTSGFSAAPFVAYVEGMLAFRVPEASASAVTPPLISVTVISASLLLAYIPLTHMSHFFTKWFTWHKIRWDDEPNVRGGRIEKMIEKALQFPVTWSAPHIQGDGKKSWADVATEEMKSK